MPSEGWARAVVRWVLRGIGATHWLMVVIISSLAERRVGELMAALPRAGAELLCGVSAVEQDGACDEGQGCVAAEDQSVLDPAQLRSDGLGGGELNIYGQ